MMTDGNCQAAEREMFEVSRRGALRLLASEPDLTVFATWSLGLLQGTRPGPLRHAACDGVLAALEGDGDDGPGLRGGPSAGPAVPS